MTTNKTEPLPQLGYCAHCIREGVWNHAVTQYAGASTCAHHLIYNEGIGELELPDNLTESAKQLHVLDQLAHRNPTGNSSGF